MPASTFAPGALVRARQREWVVLPESEPDLLVVRPLGGTDDEITGIDLVLEDVAHAQFGLPDPETAGDYRSARLLYDALRLGFRASAGPFRSFARLAVEPRPYQLVPLLLALRHHPAVRLLLADDVGIGKTIEAGLIAAELLARHDAQGLTVLCPPHLAEQWQRELAEKFHLHAVLVLPSTVRALERALGPAESIFTAHPITVVSMDYIKSERHRDEFVRACPNLVIVDEAHTVALSGDPRSAQHRRHDLVRALSEDPNRHLILVTATPHSGKSDAFRSLLALLDRRWLALPDDLSGPDKAPIRRDLARFLVQRRREDIRHYAREDTPFPEREGSELTYDLTPAYAALFNDVLAYTRERLTAPDAQGRIFRVRWWAALGLLRALASSPAAAAATLRTRAMALDVDSEDAVDEMGRTLLLDREDDDATLFHDQPYGAETEDEPSDRARLNTLAKRADALHGTHDAKRARALTLVKRLVDDGFQPIVFCRFIATAEYLAEALRSHLRGVEVVAVTGLLPAAERESRVNAMAEHPKRVLVATDCLSEGINLQEHFNAVVHYDLAWNPTRHEQREGRVDRYGQPRDAVKVVTLYGRDNKIDGIVLDVLLRKHQQIRKDLGVSVPVPAGSEALLEAVFEGLVLRGDKVSSSQMLLFDTLTAESPKALHLEWDRASDREKRSRTLFAQDGIKTEEVVRELTALREAMGGAPDVERFVREAVRLHGGAVEGNSPARILTHGLPRSLREATGWGDLPTLPVRFRLEGPRTVPYLARTHPYVEGLATHVLDTALEGEGVGRRSGVMRTPAVSSRTTLLLLRFRFHLVSTSKYAEKALLAEEAGLMAFQGGTDEPLWLAEDEAAKLLDVPPTGNVSPDQTRHFLSILTDGFPALTPALNAEASRRGQALLDAHRRVRDAAQATGRYRVEPHLPVDVLGVYVLLPTPRL